MIGDDRLGRAYTSKILSLGLEISQAKTHVSSDTFEFAKRFFVRGIEVSPFPISAIVDNIKSYPLLVASLMGEEKKGFPLGDSIPGLIEALYEDFRMPNSFRRDIRKKSWVCMMGTLALQSRVTPADYLTVVARLGDLAKENQRVPKEIGNLLFRNTLKSLYYDTRASVVSGGGDIGNINMLLQFNLPHYDGPEGLQFYQAHPIHQITGRIEEAFDKLDQIETSPDFLEEGL